MTPVRSFGTLVLAFAVPLASCAEEPDKLKRVSRAEVDESPNHGYAWVPHRPDEKFPEGRYDGGYDTQFSSALSVCRVAHEGALHPGKIFGGKCSIGNGGKEYNYDQYDVLVARQDAFFHISSEKLELDNALVGGHDGQGRPIHACVAKQVVRWVILEQNHGYHPGKYVAGKCNFGFGRKETSSSEFWVWGLGAPLASLPAAVPGGNCPPGETSCGCRDFTGCSKPGYCLCLADDGKNTPEERARAGASVPAGSP